MKIVVTGANGYLGSLIIEYLEQQGFECIKLVRHPKENNEKKFILGSSLDSDLFMGIDGLIHVAYDFSLINWQDIYKINVLGSIELFRQAKLNGVKTIIFISSMSSFNQSKSKYGQAKYLIEQELKATNEYVIRPGLIYGNKPGGMVAALIKLAKLPLLPIVKIKAPLYLCNYSDLLELIYQLLIRPNLEINHPINAANQTPYTFRQILKIMGARVLITIPWQVVWGLLRILEFFRIKLRTGSDNLISLIHQNPNPDFSTVKTLGVSFRDFK